MTMEKINWSFWASQLDYNENSISVIKEMRKEYTQYQEKMNIERKSLGRDAVELSKWLKEEIKYYLRLEKSATLWINYLEGADRYSKIKDFPDDYAEELLIIISAYWLALIEK